MLASLRERIEQAELARDDRESIDDLLERLQTSLTELSAENGRLDEARHTLEVGQRRYRARLDLVLQQIPASVLVVDESGRIVLTNRDTEELFAALGGPRPEHYTDLVLLGTDGLRCPHAERPLTRALRSGQETMGRKFLLELAGGRIRAVEMSASPLREPDGVISGAVLTTLDVTEREQRERADKEFLANAAHQLRNPLAAIRGAVEVLQNGAKEEQGARDRFLAHIERESERLTRLARALLVLARAQSQREAVKKEIVSLQTILRDVLGRADPRPGVALELRCDPHLAGLSSRELLEESLACLLDNAVRHAKERVLLEGRSENGALTIEVRDDGPGMPDEVRARVFERFYAAGDDSGFGLGLAIASQAAEAMGTSLELDSEPGAGTSARLVVPAVRMLGP